MVSTSDVGMCINTQFSGNYCVVVPDQKRPQLRAQSGKKEISEITGQFLASVEMDSLLLCPSNAGIRPAFLSKAS